MKTQEHRKGIRRDFRTLKAVMLLLCCLLLLPVLRGQNTLPAKQTITGVVLDSEGEGLIGATVAEKGSTNGTVVGANGRFSITVAPGATLQISYLGHVTQEVSAVDGVRVTLQETATELEDVVVVAYGQQKKVSVTASIATIQTKELKQSPAANLSASLAGRLPGLTAMQTTGQPGAQDAVNLYLRGVGTTNGATPLIMIDGVPRDANLLATLDPNEIASLSILKDASATAVFGVRGANGVILITTRRGQTGKMELSISADYSVQQLTIMPPHVHSYTYAELKNEAARNSGQDLPYTAYDIEKYRDGSDPVFHPDRNLAAEYYTPIAPQTRLNANMSGGTDKVKYFVNAGYIGQGSNFKTEENKQYGFDPAFKMNRYNFRGNLDFNAAKNLKISLNLASYLQKANSPNLAQVGFANVDDLTGEVLGFILDGDPGEAGPLTVEGFTDSDGTPIPAGLPLMQTPSKRSAWGDLNGFGYEERTNAVLNSSLSVDWALPFITKGLSAKAMISYDSEGYEKQEGATEPTAWVQTIRGREASETSHYHLEFLPSLTPLKLRKESHAKYYTNMQFSLNYDRTFGSHAVTGMALVQRDSWDENGGALPYNILGVASRFTYGYDSRYLAEVNLGYNGSEQFAPGNRFGFFPAFSAGWVASNEAFLKGNRTLTNLKLRASYGEVGNDKLGDDRFLYIGKIYQGDPIYTPSLGRETTISQQLVGNEELRWEVAKKQNYGLDLQLFSALSLTVDVFFENRSDILISRGAIPDLQGVPAAYLPKVNMGTMENRGYELELTYQKIFSKDFSVNARANYAFNRNKVTFNDEAQLGEDFAYRYRTTGYALGQPFGYVIDYSNGSGYITTQEELDYATGAYDVGEAPRLGDFLYKNLTDDDKINTKDQAPIGYSNIPEIGYGFSVAISWKNLDCSFLFSGIAHVSMAAAGFRYNEDVVQHAWTQERWDNGEKIEYPALSPNNVGSSYQPNSFFMLDRSFLRLKTAEIGYTLPAQWVQKVGIGSARIYVNGNNLLTFTKMTAKYMDPEQEDASRFPLAKMVNVGVNVTF
ncbi:MAG: TonB-dependent receptor [Prevotellaceae bacterium]|jgi:TonB-linked SusC/RagA family outer membrane protein|nr:TonB-dependent receptor [Prevotellaceae bacterium]